MTEYRKTTDAEIFGISQSVLSSRGALNTAREIAQQPQKWRALADQFENNMENIAALTAQLDAETFPEILFTGAGSSAYAGEIAATETMFSRRRRARMVATTDIVSGCRNYLLDGENPLLVSFARSGDSPESLAATRIMDSLGGRTSHLYLTCNPDGALAKSVDGNTRRSIIMPEGTNDAGFAMTSSFTCMTLAALALFAAPDLKSGISAIRSLADRADALLAQWAEIAELAKQEHHRVIYLGSGPQKGAATEAALKLLELTDGKVMACSYNPMEFRHGPKTVVSDKRTLVVGFLNRNEDSRRYTNDILDELVRDARAEVWAVSPEPGTATQGVTEFSAGRNAIPGPGDGWLAVENVVFAQTFAFFKSLSLGFTVDNPVPSGEVNRVVQHVKIYA